MHLQTFKYENMEDLTTLEIDGEIWFVANEVCKVLEIQNSRKAISTLDDDEKLMYTIDTSGQNRKVNIVSESGLYALIFKSNKPEAKKFRKWITKEVIPSIRKKGLYNHINRAQLPNFIIRYRDNMHKLPKDQFSVISEMYARLYMELEKVGYQIPDKALGGKQMMPDISVGRGFASFLRDNNSEFFGTHQKYAHTFPDGREVLANMYHIDALPDFIKYVNNHWIPDNAIKYFEDRDPLALDYLPKLLKA